MADKLRENLDEALRLCWEALGLLGEDGWDEDETGGSGLVPAQDLRKQLEELEARIPGEDEEPDPTPKRRLTAVQTFDDKDQLNKFLHDYGLVDPDFRVADIRPFGVHKYFFLLIYTYVPREDGDEPR